MIVKSSPNFEITDYNEIIFSISYMSTNTIKLCPLLDGDTWWQLCRISMHQQSHQSMWESDLSSRSILKKFNQMSCVSIPFSFKLKPWVLIYIL